MIQSRDIWCVVGRPRGHPLNEYRGYKGMTSVFSAAHKRVAAFLSALDRDLQDAAWKGAL